MTRFKRIFAVFISVLILSMSIGNCFITTNNISRVYAAEIVVAEAASAAWELIVLFLAELGITGAVIDNKEAVMELYAEKAEADLELGRFIVNGAKDSVMWVYDSVSDAVSSIPWDEYVEALKGYHDNAVDNLTGIYAKYCPELIGYTREFANGLATGAIVVEGVNDNVFFNESMIDKQWSGESFDYCANFNTVLETGDFETLNLSTSYDFPIVGYFDSRYVYNGEYSIHFYNFSKGLSTLKLNGIQTFINNKTGKIFKYDFNSVYFSTSKCLSFSYGANFPIFGNLTEAENYLKGISDVTGAINWGGVIDNDDLPFWGLSKALSDAIARAPDIGIGSIGAGTLVNDWADDIPFVGLTDIQDYVDKVSDVVDGIRDGVIDGTFDLADDIPDLITDPYVDAWDDVLDNSIPADDPRVKDPAKDKPTTGEKPTTSDKPITVPTDDVIDLPLLVPDVTSGFSDISDTLKTKFPFSLPWDLHYLLTGLASTPKTPVYYLPLVIERLGINETIVVDMSDFEELSRLSRAMLSFIWAYVLINWTVKIVSVRKEE